MPPVLIAGAIAAGAAGIAGASLPVALIVGAASAAVSALTGPGDGSAGTAPAQRKQTFRSPASPMVGVIGLNRMSGVTVFAEEVKSRDEINICIALAGHLKNDEVARLSKAIMENKEFKEPAPYGYLGNVHIRYYDGSQTTIDDIEPELKNLPSWSDDMINKGIAFAHVRLRYNRDLFPNGIPNFVFELDNRVLGKNGVQVPMYSADAFVEYMKSVFGADDDEIDTESIKIARSICAEQVKTGDGKMEPRYTCNGAFNYSERHKSNLAKILATCAGRVTYNAGKFGLQVGAYNGPADFTLTTDDIIGDIKFKPQPGRKSLFNTVKGKHVSPDHQFQEVDFPQVQSPEFVEQDGEELDKDLNLEWVHSPYQAQRLAAIEVARSRLTTLVITCNMRAYPCKPGRNIRLNIPEAGYKNKEFIVEDWSIDASRGIKLTLRADDPRVWTDIVGKVPVIPPEIDLPDPSKVASVTGIHVEEREINGVWESRINWSHPHPNSISVYQIAVDKKVGEKWELRRNESVRDQFIIMRNPETGQYRARVTAFNANGVQSVPTIHEFWLNVPAVTMLSLDNIVDNTVYPATAEIVGKVHGADKFPPASIVYESETKQPGKTWMPAGKGTTPVARLTGLDAGKHEARMRAVPPFGDTSNWVSTTLEVFAAEQPTDLAFTPDPDSNYWGKITWKGQGQSWDIEIRQGEKVVLGKSATEHSSWLEWRPPGNYLIFVRARAGARVSDWSAIEEDVACLLPPTDLVFKKSGVAGSMGILTWKVADSRQTLSEIDIRNSKNESIYSTTTAGTQITAPDREPDTYTMKVRGHWLDTFSEWSSIRVPIRESVPVPTDLKYEPVDDPGMIGKLTWNNYGLPSEVQIIDKKTDEIVLSRTTIYGFYFVPIMGMANYVAKVRNCGEWSKSGWATTDYSVGRPNAPTNLKYAETPDNPASAGQLSWSASKSAGVTGYDVKIKNSAGHFVVDTKVSGTRFDTGNLPVDSYTSCVRAYSMMTHGVSDWARTPLSVSALNRPTDLTVVEKLVDTATGYAVLVVASWTGNNARATSFDLEYRSASSGKWFGMYTGSSTTATSSNMEAGDYYFRVRATAGAMLSGWTETSKTVKGLNAPPANITNLHLSGFDKQAQLTWDRIRDIGVLNGGSIQIKHTAHIGEAANWATANPITDRLPGSATLSNVPLRQGTYLVKAVNPAGFWSKKAAIVVSNMGSEAGYNCVESRIEPKGWPGEKFKAKVDPAGTLTLRNEGWDVTKVAPARSAPWTHKDGVWTRKKTTDWGGLVICDSQQPGTVLEIEVNVVSWADSKSLYPAVYYSRSPGPGNESVPLKKGKNKIRIEIQRFGAPWIDLEAGSLVVKDIKVTDINSPPHYIMQSPLDLKTVFTVRLHLECDGTVYEVDTIDDRKTNIDSWPMFDGVPVGDTNLLYEVCATDDDPKSKAATWTPWTKFFFGEFRARAFKLRVILDGATPISAGTLAGLKLVADVPDRQESGTMTAPAAGLTVKYQTPFLAPARVFDTGQGMVSGDYSRITNSTSAGFKIQFFNSTGKGISRKFDWSAISYGEGKK